MSDHEFTPEGPYSLRCRVCGKGEPHPIHMTEGKKERMDEDDRLMLRVVTLIIVGFIVLAAIIGVGTTLGSINYQRGFTERAVTCLEEGNSAADCAALERLGRDT